MIRFGLLNLETNIIGIKNDLNLAEKLAYNQAKNWGKHFIKKYEMHNYSLVDKTPFGNQLELFED